MSDCEICIRGELEGSVGCKDRLDLCESTPKCYDLFRCTMDAGCWFLKDTTRIRTCDTPCVLQLKISSLLDPAIKPFSDIADACAMIVCKDVCFNK